MAQSLKAFVRKTVTEEYLDKAPVRDATGAVRFPPNEPGKGPWEISLIKPHKRAPQPTSVLFKRKTVYYVPNPKLTVKNRNSAMRYLQSARISENMVGNNTNNNTYGRTTHRAKSEYGRHLLGNFGPTPANGSNNSNNLSNFASRLKLEGGKRTRRSFRRMGGYQTKFDSIDDEIAFLRDFLSYLGSGISRQEKLDRIMSFLLSVPHLHFMIRQPRFRPVLINKLKEWESETDVPAEFHSLRLAALQAVESVA